MLHPLTKRDACMVLTLGGKVKRLVLKFPNGKGDIHPL